MGRARPDAPRRRLCTLRHAAEGAAGLGATAMEWEAEPNARGFYGRMGGRPVRTTTSEWGRDLTVMRVLLSP